MKKQRIQVGLATIVFLTFALFWVYLALHGLQGDSNQAETFSALYGLMALFGGLLGLVVSRKWGGAKSLIGRAVLFMALGLLAQEAGQLTYSAYTYIAHIEIPYPSLGDIFYFGSVVLYIIAALSLVKALSTKATLKSAKILPIVVIIPVALLVFSYHVFLRGYTVHFNHPITVFLDFGYPLGQAFYVSLGLLALVLSLRYLGGVMKPVILFLIFALFLQYLADFTFLYQVSRNTWKVAGLNEFSYLVAYFVMTLSLIEFSAVHDRLMHRVPTKGK